MRHIVLLLALFATVFFKANAEMQSFTIDTQHTNVVWKVNHAGFSNIYGKFVDVDGKIKLNEKKLENSNVEVNIKIASIMTGSKEFDKHLLTPEFFDYKKFSVASFASIKVERTGKNKAKVYGDLILNGIKKPMILQVELNKKGIHPYTKKETIGFKATGKIKRKDFNIGNKYPAPLIGEDIELILETEATLDSEDTNKVN